MRFDGSIDRRFDGSFDLKFDGRFDEMDAGTSGLPDRGICCGRGHAYMCVDATVDVYGDHVCGHVCSLCVSTHA